jgi:splicing factor, arginine/serine-rich 4/5/6
VVNFPEETTRREDLQMLFEPFGELVRIDMKRNYAFIQFRTIPQATKAKETTNGGKLDQSVLTVEYVARQRADRDGGGGYVYRDRSPPRGGGRYDDNRYDDYPRGGGARGGGGGSDRGMDNSSSRGGGARGLSPPDDRYRDDRRGGSPDDVPLYSRGGGDRGMDRDRGYPRP